MKKQYFYRMSNILSMIFIISLMIYRFYYVSLSSRNIVFMDFWRNICQYIEPVMNNSVTFADFWKPAFGQRNFFQMFLLAFDIKYTNLNCIWESYAGIIAISFTDLVILFKWIKVVSEKQNRSVIDIVVDFVLITSILLIPFSLQQWEILSLQFSFAFMIRVCAYYFIFYKVDEIFHTDMGIGQIIFIGTFTGIVIALLSQLYWCALIIVLAISWGVYFVLNRKFDLRRLLAFWMPALLGVITYVYGIPASGVTGGNGLTIIFSGEYFKAICYALVGSVISQGITFVISEKKIIVIALAMVAVILLCIWQFFSKNIADITYFPMMLYAYGLISAGIISYGRLTAFDASYMLSSRYACETLSIWVGIGLTCALLVRQRKYIFIIPIVLIVFFIIQADVAEMKTAPFRGNLKDELIETITKIDDYSDDELNGLQAPADQVRQGVSLMKKYKLNVFRD